MMMGVKVGMGGGSARSKLLLDGPLRWAHGLTFGCLKNAGPAAPIWAAPSRRPLITALESELLSWFICCIIV